MGVKGLWTLLQPTGHPVTLESLEGKVLAIDVSIWLNQTIKGMRDKDGNPLPNAHLIGLFHRVCKLLFYRIKPIFVFDGGVPVLKKQTLIARRQRKEFASEKSDRAAKHLLDNLLKHHALSTVLGTQGGSTVAPVPSTSQKPDLFQLPPLPVPSDRPSETGIDTWEERMDQRNIIHAEFQNLDDIDIESEDFKSLPPEIQHEILIDLKESNRLNSWARMHEMPEESNDFSNFQLERLRKRSKLTQKLDGVRKEINMRNSGEMAEILAGVQAAEVMSSKLASEDNAHYILIKGLSTVKEDEVKLEPGSAALGGSSCQSEQEKKILQLAKEGGDIVNIIKKERELTKGCISVDKNNVTDRVLTVEAQISDLNPNENTAQDLHHTNLSDKPEIPSEKDLPEDNKGPEAVLEHPEVLSSDDEVTPVKSVKTLPDSSTVGLSSDDSNSSDIVELKKDNSPKAGPNIDEETGEVTSAVDNGMEGGFVRDDSDAELTQDDEVIGDAGEITSIDLAKDVSSNHSLEERGLAGAEKLETATSENSSKAPVDIPTNYSQIEDSSRTEPTIPITNDSSSSDEGFLAVEINPNAEADELFPASMFEMQSTAEAKPDAVDDGLEVPEEAVTDDAEALMPDDFQVMEETNEFQGLSKEELLELQTVLMSENSQLNQERGQQNRMASSVTEQMTLEAQELLQLFGVPYLRSPMEAEAQCAYLDQTGQTQGSITDDSDIWLFGGRHVYKNFFNQGKHVEYFRAENIGRQLLLDKEKLISLALVCGSDYTEGIEGLGPVHGMEILGEFPGEGLAALRNFKEWWTEAQKQIRPPVETKLKAKLRKCLLNPGFPSQEVVDAYLHPEVDKSTEKFSWGRPDLDLLRQFASEKFGWSKTKTDDVILPVIKQVNCSQTQQHITSFFQPELESEPCKLKSKRVQRILNRMRNPDLPGDTARDPLPPGGRRACGRGNLRGKRGGRGTKGTGRGTRKAKGTVELSESSSDEEQPCVDNVVLSESSSDSDSNSKPTIGKRKALQKSRGNSKKRAKPR